MHSSDSKSSSPAVLAGAAKKGYIDFNFAPPGAFTVGSIIGGGALSYSYVGFSLGSPGIAITGAPFDTVTEGWNFGLQFGFFAGAQVGYVGGDWFFEMGMVTPGVSLSAYKIWRVPNSYSNWQ